MTGIVNMKTTQFKNHFKCEYKNIVTIGLTRYEAMNRMLLIVGLGSI